MAVRHTRALLALALPSFLFMCKPVRGNGRFRDRMPETVRCVLGGLLRPSRIHLLKLVMDGKFNSSCYVCADLEAKEKEKKMTKQTQTNTK